MFSFKHFRLARRANRRKRTILSHWRLQWKCLKTLIPQWAFKKLSPVTEPKTYVVDQKREIYDNILLAKKRSCFYAFRQCSAAYGYMIQELILWRSVFETLPKHVNVYMYIYTSLPLGEHSMGTPSLGVCGCRNPGVLRDFSLLSCFLLYIFFSCCYLLHLHWGFPLWRWRHSSKNRASLCMPDLKTTPKIKYHPRVCRAGCPVSWKGGSWQWK